MKTWAKFENMQNNLHFRNSSCSAGEEEEEAVFICNCSSSSSTDQGEDIYPTPVLQTFK